MKIFFQRNLQNKCQIQFSAMLNTITLMLVLLIVINHPCSAANIRRAFRRYNYFWNGKISNYNELEPCPPTYWSLEIYDEEIQQNANEYILYVFKKTADNNVSRSIENYLVPLNISCQNQTDCIWNDTNTRAIYFNWNNTSSTYSSHFGKESVYYFKATKQNISWNILSDDEVNPTFAKICMNETTTSTKATTKISYQASSMTHSISEGTYQMSTVESKFLEIDSNLTRIGGDIFRIDFEGKLIFVIVVTASSLLILVLLGIILCIIVKRNRRNNEGTTSNSICNDILQIPTKDIETPHNDLVFQTAETDFRQNDLLYASLSFSINLSSSNKTESKPLEEEQASYFGPMGDVYSLAQK